MGCYTGADDGVFGPETDAAIVAFQKASGLSPDGELGTQTEAALNKAVAEKQAVCGGTATTTTAKAGSTTTSTASPNGAPCTATALLGGLPAEGETIASYVCSGGYAAGKPDRRHQVHPPGQERHAGTRWTRTRVARPAPGSRRSSWRTAAEPHRAGTGPTSSSDRAHSRAAASGSRAHGRTPDGASGSSVGSATEQSSR